MYKYHLATMHGSLENDGENLIRANQNINSAFKCGICWSQWIIILLYIHSGLLYCMKHGHKLVFCMEIHIICSSSWEKTNLIIKKFQIFTQWVSVLNILSGIPQQHFSGTRKTYLLYMWFFKVLFFPVMQMLSFLLLNFCNSGSCHSEITLIFVKVSLYTFV